MPGISRVEAKAGGGGGGGSFFEVSMVAVYFSDNPLVKHIMV